MDTRTICLIITAAMAGFVLGFGTGFETARGCVRRLLKKGTLRWVK